MSYWSEITNDFTETNPSPKDGDVLAVNYIDAWREGEEEGNVIAKVLLSKHGDVMVDYVEGIARIDDLAQEVIADSKARIVEVFKARQNQHEQTPDACASLGKSIFVKWDNLDVAINNWAREYFGSHVSANGSRDEDSFGIELTGLKADDFEAFSKLYEEFDKDDFYEPESEFQLDSNYPCALPSIVSLGVMPRVFAGEGLITYGTAVATYDGVFFTERSIYAPDLPERMAEPMVNIDLGFGKLQAVSGGDPAYKEIVVLLEDAKTGLEQPLAIIGQEYHYDPNTDSVRNEVVPDKGISVRLWTDKDSDDFTHSFSIGVLEHDRPLAAELPAKPSLSHQIKSAESRTGAIENTKGAEPER